MKSPSSPRTILVPIYNGTYFSNSLKLAKAIKNKSGYRVFFYFGRRYPGILDHIAQLDDDFDFFFEGAPSTPLVEAVTPQTESDNNSFKNSFEGKLNSIRRTTQISFLLDFFFSFRDWLRLKRRLSNIQLMENVQAYVLPADNRYQFPQIVKLAHSFSRSVILVPHWFAGEKEVEESFSHSTLHRPTRFQAIFLRVFAPSFLREINIAGSVFYMIPIPFHEICLALILRIVPPHPWILHSGFADLVLVETEKTFEFAQTLGFRQSQLRVTGSVVLDEIDEIRSFSNQDLRIVVAVAPDMFASRTHVNLPFQDYAEYLSYLCETLIDYGFRDAVLSLHPSDAGQSRELLLKYGFIISPEPIHSLLARTRLFVATISATIQWADYVGARTLNFDFYQYRYPDYINYDSVHTVFDKVNFEAGLGKFKDLSVSLDLHSLPQGNVGRVNSVKYADQIIEAILLHTEGE